MSKDTLLGMLEIVNGYLVKINDAGWNLDDVREALYHDRNTLQEEFNLLEANNLIQHKQ